MRYSRVYEVYRDAHPACEACGRSTKEWPHHLRSRGAGGTDEPENLLELCREHHAEWHTMGRKAFCKHFPGLREKVDAALAVSRVVSK